MEYTWDESHQEFDLHERIERKLDDDQMDPQEAAFWHGYEDA